jgi:acetamidase/formamidase
MSIVSFIPTHEQYSFTFGGVAPVMRVKPGTVLSLFTEDAYCGRITSIGDKASSSLVAHELNPQTGPFYIEGAEPGDTLAVHIVDLTPARSWGASALIPFFGGLSSTPQSPTLQHALEERTWIYEYDSDAKTVGFASESYS